MDQDHDVKGVEVESRKGPARRGSVQLGNTLFSPPIELAANQIQSSHRKQKRSKKRKPKAKPNTPSPEPPSPEPFIPREKPNIRALPRRTPGTLLLKSVKQNEGDISLDKFATLYEIHQENEFTQKIFCEFVAQLNGRDINRLWDELGHLDPFDFAIRAMENRQVKRRTLRRNQRKRDVRKRKMAEQQEESMEKQHASKETADLEEPEPMDVEVAEQSPSHSPAPLSQMDGAFEPMPPRRAAQEAVLQEAIARGFHLRFPPDPDSDNEHTRPPPNSKESGSPNGAQSPVQPGALFARLAGLETSSLMGFDQDTGEMLCIPESPYRSDAPDSVAGSEELGSPSKILGGVGAAGEEKEEDEDEDKAGDM